MPLYLKMSKRDLEKGGTTKLGYQTSRFRSQSFINNSSFTFFNSNVTAGTKVSASVQSDGKNCF